MVASGSIADARLVPASPVTAPRPDLRGPLRLVVGLLVAGILGLLLWLGDRAGLHRPIDIVGYPSFTDFDYKPQFLVYRLVVWELPIVTCATVWLLRRRGPLKDPTIAGRRLSRTVAEPTVSAVASRAATGAGAVLRLLPQSALVALAVDSSGADLHRGFSPAGVGAGLAYLVLFAVLSSGLTQVWNAPPLTIVAWLNALTAPAVAVVAFQRFAAGTAVVDEAGRVRHFDWATPWIAVLLLAACYGWGLWRRRSGWSVERLEWWAVTVLSGALLVAISTARLRGSLGPIQGFDDMQSVTGADLLTRGYFPWRDFYFIHGIFEDVLRSLAAFPVFGHSLWATTAAYGMWWTPLYAVGCYLFLTRLTPQRWLLRLVLVVGLLWLLNQSISVRWCFLGWLVLLFGEALRHRARGWTVLFTVSTFVVAVMVPETTFLVMATTVVLVAAEVWERPAGRWRLRDFPRTATYVVTGAICTVVWLGYLLTQGALGSFIGYYVIFGPGHAESGALPLDLVGTQTVMNFFLVLVLIVLAGLAVVCAALLRGRSMTPTLWMLLATALFSGLYNEKALGRFDAGHILQVATASAPLAALLVVVAVERLDRRIEGSRRRWSVTLRRLRRGGVGDPVSATVLVALLLLVGGPIFANAWAIPSNNSARVTSVQQSEPLLGFARPDAYSPDYVSRMQRVLTALAGKNGSVFDFTNSPGYFYYLMQRPLPTRYYHISMALPEFSQRDVVAQLKRSRPAAVVFDTFNIGLPAWDGPRAEVRHFIVSDYVLEHYRPVVSVEGTMFLLRNDLRVDRSAMPASDPLTSVSDLSGGALACDWGDSANYLTSEPSARTVTLSVPRARAVRQVTVRGWAYDAAHRSPVRELLVAVGDRAVLRVRPTASRPDVGAALALPNATRSGFAGSTITRAGGDAVVFAVLADGRAHPVASSPASLPARLRLPSGSTVPVSKGPATGSLDALSFDERRVAVVDIPRGTDPSDFDLATFSRRSGSIGSATVAVGGATSSREGSAQPISIRVLPVSERSISVRVGSCLQWHDMSTRRLVISQRGGRPIERVTLSNVRGEPSP